MEHFWSRVVATGGTGRKSDGRENGTMRPRSGSARVHVASLTLGATRTAQVPPSDRLVLAREERDRFGCEAYRGFPSSTAGALFPGSKLVEPQHEFLDLG